tara:strand:- start:1029 stop:1217 length:189 start_codon:yes stop_codon:yes gene_type:complete
MSLLCTFKKVADEKAGSVIVANKEAADSLENMLKEIKQLDGKFTSEEISDKDTGASKSSKKK